MRSFSVAIRASAHRRTQPPLMTNKRTIAALSLVAVALTACRSGIPLYVQSLPQPDTPPVNAIPARGGPATDWGLALSGGGVRSAYFVIGVMKALYDAGYMDSVDVISSVSGGGYASYWLYRRHLDSANVSRRFGEHAFSDARFDKSVCELEALGNFHTYWRMISRWVVGRSFSAYQRSIRRSFGFDDTDDPEPALNFIMQDVATGKAPFFILNATIDANGRERLQNALEISPAWFGNPSIGYHRWGTGDALPQWSESVASAGAAMQPLRRFFRNYSTPDPLDSLRAWDGGKSENLGAIALIRRRMKNIIVVDAEHDPDYNFEAYLYLRQLLPSEGYEISVPVIDSFIDTRASVYTRFRTAVSPGMVTWTPRPGEKPDTTRILYLKMGRPAAVDSLFDAASPAYTEGKALRERIESLLASATGLPWDRCGKLEGHPDGFRRAAAIYNTATYALMMDELVKPDVARRGPRFLRYDFPHMTTVDQSYYTDQLRALVGLGYLEGSHVALVDRALRR